MWGRGIKCVMCWPDYLVRNRYNPAEYAAFLAKQERIVDRRIRQNACPEESLSNFKIEGFLTSGFYGQIYKVTHKTKGTTHSLKIQIKPEPKQTAEIRRVIFEKKISYAVTNEFILSAEFAFQDADNLYLVTPYAPYGDITNFLGAGPLEEETVRFIAVQLIFGIEYLHACLIAHRDLKPQNILVFGDFYVKICDLGLARKLRACTNFRAHSFVGTPHYMAPEVFQQGLGYGRSCDWWSLGITLYELRYNAHPFVGFAGILGITVIKLLTNIMPLSWPRGHDENEGLNNLIAGLLIKDHRMRLGCYRNGVELVKGHDGLDGQVTFPLIYNKAVVFRSDVEQLRVEWCEPEMSGRGPVLDDPNPFDEF